MLTLAMDPRADFPLFEKHPTLVYLDSAATTHKPQAVIDAITAYYASTNANPGRGLYSLSEAATTAYEAARSSVAQFIHADPKEIVFTSGATESLNIVAARVLPLLNAGRDEIVLSAMEHHSNLVPWQEFAKRHDFTLKFIPITKDFNLDYEAAHALITEKTALVSVAHASNVLGTINDVKQISDAAHKAGALTIVDAAQSVAHMPLSVKDLACDFLVFSAHKLYGPMGIGVLYGRKEHLAKMDPLIFGGGMVETVTFDSATLRDAPYTFEGGTPDVAGAQGLAAAITFMQEKRDSLKQESLIAYAFEQLATISGLTLYAAAPEQNIGIISFTLDGVHPHDVASVLNESGIAIRAGNHCAQPLHEALGITASCRISLGIYNTTDDIDRLTTALNKVVEVFTS